MGGDVNRGHTAVIEPRISVGGLGNAEVITAHFAELPEDLGQFEFMPLNGIFNWVAPRVRDEMLSIAGRYLAHSGLLLVSNNVMPG